MPPQFAQVYGCMHACICTYVCMYVCMYVCVSMYINVGTKGVDVQKGLCFRLLSSRQRLLPWCLAVSSLSALIGKAGLKQILQERGAAPNKCTTTRDTKLYREGLGLQARFQGHPCALAPGRIPISAMELHPKMMDQDRPPVTSLQIRIRLHGDIV